MNLFQELKIQESKTYNYIFNKKTGFFARWGETKNDDPDYSPLGPEIADIEIVKGDCKGGCSFCYKSNGEINNHYMNLSTYKKVLNKISGNLTQVALGITDIDGNPDFWEILEHTRSQGIIPNYTTHGLDITPEIAKRTKELCGAVAVSIVNKQRTYNAIKLFNDAGMDQVNIHFTLSKESYDKAFEIMEDSKNDPRLRGLNAIVFLSLKQKGRGVNHSKVSSEQYKKLVNYALDNEIRIGFDSCSAPLFLNAVKDHPNYSNFVKMSEPCESYLFSIYVNTFGECTPCSFTEDEGYNSYNLLKVNDFLKEIWFNHSVSKWRDTLINTKDSCSIEGCRMCPHYDLYSEELYKKAA